MPCAAQESQVATLPLGRRVPRGRMRWYLVKCPEGQEASTCAKVRQIVSPQILEDAFVPRRERQRKVHGTWVTDVVGLFDGYFVVATKDAPALSRALAKLTFPAQLVGSVGSGYAPVAEEVREFLEGVMDQGHVVRLSWGEIVSDALRVNEGPLVGKEARVARILRRKSLARVRVAESDGAATLSLPLAIPVRR